MIWVLKASEFGIKAKKPLKPNLAHQPDGSDFISEISAHPFCQPPIGSAFSWLKLELVSITNQLPFHINEAGIAASIADTDT